jgi:mannose-6-phosphate isomerase-like protein (cupin superfamily)
MAVFFSSHPLGEITERGAGCEKPLFNSLLVSREELCMSANSKTFELDSTYVQLLDGPAAVLVPVDPDFWERIGERTELHEGRLLMVTHQTGPWTHWEMHPSGDEILYLLSGKMDVILEINNAQEIVTLNGGKAVIVPAGTWHTVKILSPGDLLSITRGAGTQLRTD